MRRRIARRPRLSEVTSERDGITVTIRKDGSPKSLRIVAKDGTVSTRDLPPVDDKLIASMDAGRFGGS